MNTYSHFLLAAVLRKPLAEATKEDKNIPKLRTSALYIGSFLPDALLIIIAIFLGSIDLSRGTFGPPGPDGANSDSLLGKLFNDWFFNNPWVMSAQQLFHSPVMLIIFITLGYLLWRKGIRGGGWFFWLTCSAMLHTLFDIALHYDDGPLYLWPFNWDIRFYSPVSYWDPEHYGVPAAIYEHLMDIVFIGILVTRGRGKMLWKQPWIWIAIFAVPLAILIALQLAGVFPS